MKKKIASIILAITCLFTMGASFIALTDLPNSAKNNQSSTETFHYNNSDDYYCIESSDQLTCSPLWGRVDQRPLKPAEITGRYL